jgi:hypothetical protein
MDNRSSSNTEIDLDKPLTNSEIQDKIDLEFDKINRAASRGEAKDFTEVDRLTKLLK